MLNAKDRVLARCLRITSNIKNMVIVIVMLIVPDHLQLERTCHADAVLGMRSDVIGSILAGSGPVFLTSLYLGLS